MSKVELSNDIDFFQYLFLSFSFVTDFDHDEDEFNEVGRILQEYGFEIDDMNESFKVAMSVFQHDIDSAPEDKPLENVLVRLAQVAIVMGKHFSDDLLKQIINDLERIGKSDGDYTDSEKHLVSVIKDIFFK